MDSIQPVIHPEIMDSSLIHPEIMDSIVCDTPRDHGQYTACDTSKSATVFQGLLKEEHFYI